MRKDDYEAKWTQLFFAPDDVSVIEDQRAPGEQVPENVRKISEVI